MKYSIQEAYVSEQYVYVGLSDTSFSSGFSSYAFCDWRNELNLKSKER
jgi:hypothetical protein